VENANLDFKHREVSNMDMRPGFVEAVRSFMATAGQSTDRFNARQATLYTGLQLEEMAEKLKVIAGGTVTPHAQTCLLRTVEALESLSTEFKQGFHTGDVMRADYAGLLDADIDLAWVSIGAALSTSTNTPAAVAEVSRSNHDKFPNGVVVRDENGKIAKPVSWLPPNLKLFVDPPKF
jgi:predicted HAD superfamily Cof-like phosphohydrolase